MAEANSFKFYSNFLKAIDVLPENRRANACYEFCKFGITGELPEDENLAMFCIGVSASVQKYQGRGGNNNPSGKNQHAGQSSKNSSKEVKEVKEVKLGQSGQSGRYSQTETKTETKTETINNKPKQQAEEKPFLEDFNKFWEKYPKQRIGNKDKAYRAYVRALKEKRATAPMIDFAVKYYAKSDTVENGYAKGCEAWLNADGFKSDWGEGTHELGEDGYLFIRGLRTGYKMDKDGVLRDFIGNAWRGI